MGADAADEVCDEASAVFLVSKDPGFGGRCLNDRQQLHLPQIDFLNKILPRKKKISPFPFESQFPFKDQMRESYLKFTLSLLFAALVGIFRSPK